jgi:hypothetical protein
MLHHYIILLYIHIPHTNIHAAPFAATRCLVACSYVAQDTPNVSYINSHQVIHNLREEAKASGGQGPCVVVLYKNLLLPEFVHPFSIDQDESCTVCSGTLLAAMWQKTRQMSATSTATK